MKRPSLLVSPPALMPRCDSMVSLVRVRVRVRVGVRVRVRVRIGVWGEG